MRHSIIAFNCESESFIEMVSCGIKASLADVAVILVLFVIAVTLFFAYAFVTRKKEK